MTKTAICSNKAPSAIGTYSQAIQTGNMVYISGQIALNPETMELITDNFAAEVAQVLKNLQAIAEEAGGQLNDIVKLTVYLLDFENFDRLNALMLEYFDPPYPARAAIAVKALPKGATVEIDAVMELGKVAK